MRVLDEDMQTGDDFIMLIQWSWSAPQWAKMTRQNREVTFSESSARCPRPSQEWARTAKVAGSRLGVLTLTVMCGKGAVHNGVTVESTVKYEYG